MALNDKYGAISHFWQADDWTDNVANLFVQSGAEWVRSDISPNSSPYDYSYFIPNLQRAKSRGLKLLLIIWYPTEFLTCTSDSECLNYYQQYVAAIANQFNGYVDAYEIWNEPAFTFHGWYHNDKPDLSDLPEKYVQMLKIAYSTIKSINSSVTVVGIGGTIITYGYDEYWFCNATVNLGGKSYMDAFALHPYDKPYWTPQEPAFSDVAIQDMKNRIKNHTTLFSPLPLWITETGFTDYPYQENCCGTEAQQKQNCDSNPNLASCRPLNIIAWCYEPKLCPPLGFPCFQNNCDQSFMMNRDFKMLNDAGASKIFWYEFRDYEPQSPDEEGHYGLLYSNLTQKPSFNNFKIWTGGYCDTLNKTIQNAFGSNCNSPNWNPVADINKDRSVNILDLTLWSNNKYDDEAWCNSTLGNTSDACNNCQDSDGGLNYLTRGTTSGNFTGTVYSYTDYCIDNANLREYYCNGQHNQSITASCPTTYGSNYYCYNGICKASSGGGGCAKCYMTVMDSFLPLVLVVTVFSIALFGCVIIIYNIDDWKKDLEEK